MNWIIISAPLGGKPDVLVDPPGLMTLLPFGGGPSEQGAPPQPGINIAFACADCVVAKTVAVARTRANPILPFSGGASKILRVLRLQVWSAGQFHDLIENGHMMQQMRNENGHHLKETE